MEFIKPLRNFLRPYNCVSFLQAIWFLSNHLEFGMKLPPYLAHANPAERKGSLELGFFLWELDTLAREVLLHCEPNFGKPVEDWSQVATALNKLKKAEEEGSNININAANVMSELPRIGHRQFHWQQGVTAVDLARTTKIYRCPAMNDVVRTVYGISAEQVASASFAAFATYMEYFAIRNDWPENVTELLGFNPRPVIEHLTVDLAIMKQNTHDARALNGNWVYAFNPLWSHPLIRIEGGAKIICPIPGLLVRRMTDGLYFDIAGHDVDALSAHMGPAFQDYVGEALHRANKGRFTIWGEETYGRASQRKSTVDWILGDDTASLFVEVKLLKMGRATKEVLAPDDAITNQLKKLAKAIGQVYATLRDALNQAYPKWKPYGKPVYPIIVTFDNWAISANKMASDFAGLVENELARRDIELTILSDHPYVVCNANEFEAAIQVMHQVGIQAVMEPLTCGERIGWLFSGHLQQAFSRELGLVEALFPEEIQNYLPKPPAGEQH